MSFEPAQHARLRAAVGICSERWQLSACEAEFLLLCVSDGLDREANARALRLSLSGYKKRVERTLQKAGVDNTAALVVRVLWQTLALD